VLDLPPILIGFAAGILLTAAIARSLVVRHIARLRAAEKRARAAERMAEIGSMTGGLAHEIKNPLSTIGLNAQLLDEGLAELPIPQEDKTRLSRRIAALRREVDRLRGILSDFLQFAGQVRVEPVPADLNQVVADLADFFMPQAQQQGVRLRVDLAPGPLIANLDSPHIKQAILNLMLNAVQAMQQGPGAVVDAAPSSTRSRPSTGVADSSASSPVPELILRTSRQSGSDKRPELALHIIDTGPGIDAATMERIFQPYFTTKSGGTGLGLPTARRLIEAHHGRLEVHSEPGKGSDFTIVVPAA
jgi:signal transduction histidine kinase